MSSRWMEEVQERMRRSNKILFSPESECLQELSWRLQGQTRKALVLWALECGEDTARVIKKRYPQEERPQRALALSLQWARGKIKMPIAKKAILEVHQAAKETEEMEYAARYHAVGQACSVIHTGGHAMGLPIYELTALVRELGLERAEKAVEEKIEEYSVKLMQCQKKEKEDGGPWAKFLMDERPGEI